MSESITPSPIAIPDAPWYLRGEAVAFLAAPLTVRLLVNYTHSPVGPYHEHALATLTRHGPHVFQMSVDLEASRLGGRTIWGFPKTLESLSWTGNTEHIQFRRESQRFHVRAFGPIFPLALPFWTAQQKQNNWVRVPGHIRARARLAFRGPQLALALSGFEMEIEKPQ
ncbi:hypothetical protein IAD21_04197 [Abditibacteriota bacterium]|nr:hypothetical protein IAD21_04197 [Abditibacteriota bacterium]